MDGETQQIFKEQLGKLPREVTDFLSSTNWSDDLDEVGSLYNLSEDEIYDFKSEATLVLAGLVHPDEFGDNLEQEAGIHGAVRDAIVNTVEQRIFAPVRGALVKFLEAEDSEARNDAESTQSDAEEAISTPTETPEVKKEKPTAWKSGAAPDNLPVADVPEYLTPPIPPKPSPLDVQHPKEEEGTEPAHPFEEKMKRVFTAGQQSMGDLTLEPVTPHTSYDSYREPIE